MIILYGDPGSVFVRKPLVLLREKNIPFQCDPIDLFKYTNEDFVKASPLKKIPALADEGLTLADSSVICAYLEKKFPYPQFYPEQAYEYAQALWYEEYADTVLFQAIAPCYYEKILVPRFKNGSPDESKIDCALTNSLPPVANYLEKTLVGKEFLLGTQLSIADVAIVCMFSNMYFSGYNIDKKRWPHLASYVELHLSKRSFSRVIE